MVKAIRDWDNVDRVPCSAHTLQLCVAKGLEKIKLHTKRFKKLILFFNSPKQNERLEEAQRELAIRHEEPTQSLPNSTQIDNDKEVQQGPLKTLQTINDVKTQ